jgi:hypothetical protein
VAVRAVLARGAGGAGEVAEAVEVVELGRELGSGLDLGRPQELVFDALVAAGDTEDHPLRPLGAVLHLAVGRLGRPD